MQTQLQSTHRDQIDRLTDEIIRRQRGIAGLERQLAESKQNLLEIQKRVNDLLDKLRTT